MSASLAITIAAYAVVLGALTAIRSGLGGPIGPAQIGGLIVLELAAAGQAIAATVGLIAGHEVTERGVLLAYLAVSVAILPLSWGLVGEDRTRWRGATLGLGLLAMAVVSLRSASLWRA